jgi:hypothetical protein
MVATKKKTHTQDGIVSEEGPAEAELPDPQGQLF